MDSQPRVLIVAASDDLAADLCRGLDVLGWRTVTARGEATALAALADFPVEAAVVDAAGLAPGHVERLRQAALPRRLPIMLAGDASPEDQAQADLVLVGRPHPAQTALRLEQLSRAAVAEEEAVARQATYAAYGAPLNLEDPDAEVPLRVLAAGAADIRFLALSNALTQGGAQVVAAPTPYTAFDYLHERPFDAAVLWGADDQAPALSIAAGMKRNTRLYHVPLVLYLRGAGQIDMDNLYQRGFSDVAAADTPEEETALRILALARAHRRHQAIRRALDSVRATGLTDGSTGLFTRDLFAAHLARVAEGARTRRRPLSVCVLRVAETEAVAQARHGGWLDRAMPQIGAMISRLVRVEDTPGRLANEVFAVALPATHGPAARLAAERIAAVIGCTAFDAGAGRTPFVVDFEAGVAEMGPGENAAGLLERASVNLSASRSRPV